MPRQDEKPAPRRRTHAGAPWKRPIFQERLLAKAAARFQPRQDQLGAIKAATQNVDGTVGDEEEFLSGFAFPHDHLAGHEPALARMTREAETSLVG